ncbi:MAG: AhpC/TSA family protein [Bacteroidales bacterium]|nr:AhpC/TSA family protein [Bacteroidales bacterium]
MKQILYLIIIIEFLFFSCSLDNKKSEKYKISGTINGITTNKIYLGKYIDKKWLSIDSTYVINCKFSFTGNIDIPELYNIKLTENKGTTPFFLENSVINIVINVDSLINTEISGSLTQDIFILFSDKLKPFENKLENLYIEYRKAKNENNNELMSEIDIKYDSVIEQKNLFIKEFILKNNSTVVSPYLILKHLIYYIELEVLENMLDNFDISIIKSKYITKLHERVEILRKVAIGQPASEITLNDTSGNSFSLSSLKGNFVLIDFWASWSGSCRKENPNIVLIYNEFKNKNFKILGVSFDNKKDRWIKAINDDKLTWYHISELNGWNSSAAKLYGVNSIPHTVIVDTNGIIVAKNLSGEELKNKIIELVK